jgi:hypothetical protein
MYGDDEVVVSEITLTAAPSELGFKVAVGIA